MIKNIRIRIDSINKAKDKPYVNEVCDNILESLYDNDSIVSGIGISRQPNFFYLTFALKVSKTADILMVLIREWCSCISQTEENIAIVINEIEEDGQGISYRLYKYIPNE